MADNQSLSSVSQEQPPEDLDQENPSPELSPEESQESQEALPEDQEQPAEETPAEDETPEDEAEGEEEKPATAEAKPAEKHKRTGGFQRRIERQDRQIAQLTEALSRFGGQPTQPAAPTAPKTPEAEALAQFERMMDERKVQWDAQARAQAKVAAYQKRTLEVRAAHDDWDDVMVIADEVKTNTALGQAILTSDKGPEIMYQLAKNPAELARIGALPPLEQAREVGRLEAKASGSVTSKPKPAARPPAPPSKVGGSTTSTRSLESLPISEYKRLMRSRGR